MLLEILFTYNQIFKKYPWKCAVEPLITLEIPMNFLIWDVWEPWLEVTEFNSDFQSVRHK